MVDDRNKRRARSFWGDEQRAARAKSEPGVPVEIDPEATPPPREPPAEEVFETLPPAAQVRALRNVVAEQSAAIERVWDARHVADRLGRVEQVVTEDTKQVTRLLVEVKQWSDSTKEALAASEQIERRQVVLDERLRVFFDEQFPQLVDSVKGFATALRDLDTRIGKLEASIEHVAGKQTSQAEKIVRLDERVTALETVSREKHIRSDERRRWFTWGRVALVTAGAAIATVMSQAKAIAAWLSK